MLLNREKYRHRPVTSQEECFRELLREAKDRDYLFALAMDSWVSLIQAACGRSPRWPSGSVSAIATGSHAPSHRGSGTQAR